MTDASFRALYTATEAVEIMTAAGNGLVHRRRQAVTGTRQRREADQLPAIARYTELAHHTLVAARDAVGHLYGLTPNSDNTTAPSLPTSGVPKQANVTRGLTAVLDMLSQTVNVAYDALSETCDEPLQQPTAELALLVYDHATAAYGQWSIAHRAYQRATCQRRQPIGRQSDSPTHCGHG